MIREWIDADAPVKIRAATAAYAALLVTSSWSHTARRLIRGWERVTAQAADGPGRFYAPMVARCFTMTSAMFTYEQSKACLTEIRRM